MADIVNSNKKRRLFDNLVAAEQQSGELLLEEYYPDVDEEEAEEYSLDSIEESNDKIDMTEKKRKERRRERNRMTARERRRKKKARLTYLNESVKKLSDMNEKLEVENAEMRRILQQRLASIMAKPSFDAALNFQSNLQLPLSNALNQSLQLRPPSHIPSLQKLLDVRTTHFSPC